MFRVFRVLGIGVRGLVGSEGNSDLSFLCGADVVGGRLRKENEV